MRVYICIYIYTKIQCIKYSIEEEPNGGSAYISTGLQQSYHGIIAELMVHNVQGMIQTYFDNFCELHPIRSAFVFLCWRTCLECLENFLIHNFLYFLVDRYVKIRNILRIRRFSNIVLQRNVLDSLMYIENIRAH